MVQSGTIMENLPVPRSPDAERMARHRQRRRNGLRSVTVDLRETEIDRLIQCRLLAPVSRADPFALRRRGEAGNSETAASHPTRPLCEPSAKVRCGA